MVKSKIPVDRVKFLVGISTEFHFLVMVVPISCYMELILQ